MRGSVSDMTAFVFCMTGMSRFRVGRMAIFITPPSTYLTPTCRVLSHLFLNQHLNGNTFPRRLKRVFTYTGKHWRNQLLEVNMFALTEKWTSILLNVLLCVYLLVFASNCLTVHPDCQQRQHPRDASTR